MSFYLRPFLGFIYFEPHVFSRGGRMVIPRALHVGPLILTSNLRPKSTRTWRPRTFNFNIDSISSHLAPHVQSTWG